MQTCTTRMLTPHSLPTTLTRTQDPRAQREEGGLGREGERERGDPVLFKQGKVKGADVSLRQHSSSVIKTNKTGNYDRWSKQLTLDLHTNGCPMLNGDRKNNKKQNKKYIP